MYQQQKRYNSRSGLIGIDIYITVVIVLCCWSMDSIWYEPTAVAPTAWTAAAAAAAAASDDEVAERRFDFALFELDFPMLDEGQQQLLDTCDSVITVSINTARCW